MTRASPPPQSTTKRPDSSTKAAKAAEIVRVRGLGALNVYEQLRRSILELELEPGSPLDEATLSQQFEMSRTPIREAMVRLAADGLVTTLPNRNTIVAAIDLVRLPQYFDALTLMYRVSTRSAALNHRPEHLAIIRAHERSFATAVQRRDALAMIGSNRDFHVAIAEAGGNSYFISFFARLLDEGRRILRLYYSSFDDQLPQQYVLEHEAIVTAIASGDAELCDRLGAEHAAQIVRQIQSYLARETTAGIKL